MSSSYTSHVTRWVSALEPCAALVIGAIRQASGSLYGYGLSNQPTEAEKLIDSTPAIWIPQEFEGSEGRGGGSISGPPATGTD